MFFMFNKAEICSLFPALSELEIAFVSSDTRETTYCEKTHRYTREKYILRVKGNNVKVDCSGKKSAFYALCDLDKRLREGEICDGEFVCAPTFAVRGYIEGFYGTPWSHSKRMSVMTLMAKNRMNTVFYAPKDDVYHRELWRELYPQEELMRLKELVDTAGEYYLDFRFCIAPGLSVKYSDEAELEVLMAKTKQLYSIGIRNFGLLLDDIDADLAFPEDKQRFGETVNAHIYLIEKYFAALKELDPCAGLTICPTLYNGKGDEYYIAKLGQNISPLISVFWTGRDICSREITSLEAVKFIENTHHKPLYWDNYPVNDCAMQNEMHVSPIIGRDKDLHKYAEGLISNTMEYAECSKIPLLTIADYLWDSENYDPEKSWKNAIRLVIGEEADSFIVFADHLYTSCLLDGNSKIMYALLDNAMKAIKAGNKEKATAMINAYLPKMRASVEFLKGDHPVCSELTKWSEKYFVFCTLLEKVFEYLETNEASLIDEMKAVIEKYNSMSAKISEDVDWKVELHARLGFNF